MNQSIYKAGFFFLSLLFLYLQYVLWFEDSGILNMINLKRELALQSQQNEKLKLKNQQLYAQVQRLKEDPEVLEGRARGEMGMIKKGEKFYQIIK